MQSGSTPQINDYYKDIQTPTTEDLQYKIQQLVQQGSLTPEQAQAALVGKSSMEDVSQDPATKEAQMQALSQLQDISDNGGMTAVDKDNLSKIFSDEDTKSRGARDAILQNAQERGAGGSGLELLNQMKNEQDSAGRASQRGMDVASQAQQRALEALMNQGTLATTVGGQQFNQDASKAGAMDAIAKFNAQNQQNTNLTNTEANNKAQSINLANKQNISNQNANLQTLQNKQASDIKQQQFGNATAKAAGQSGVAGQNSQIAGQNSQNQANSTNQMIGTGLTTAAMLLKDGGLVEGEPTDYDSVHTMLQPGEFVLSKEDVPDALAKMHTDEDGNFDASGFLNTLTQHKYGYSKGGRK